MPKTNVLVAKAKIDEIFANAKHQSDYVLGMFRAVYPDFDAINPVDGTPAIKSVDGMPTCSKELWTYVCDKAMAFDRKNHPGCLPGGAWLNYGFSVEEALTGWQVVPAPVTR